MRAATRSTLSSRRRVRHRKRGQTLAGLLFATPLVSALGLPLAQGLVFTETWYWDMNDANRNWTRRWQVEQRGKYPYSAYAGVYSSVIHYLKAVEALKADGDGKAVAAKMKEMPTDDPLFGKGSIRVDGRKVHEAYLLSDRLASLCREGVAPSGPHRKVSDQMIILLSWHPDASRIRLSSRWFPHRE
jgi:Periplasmic binding protein